MAEIITKEKPTLEELKANKIKQAKRKANNILSDTDWYIVRQQETSEDIPQEVLNDRKAIREKSDKIEDDINTIETKEKLKEYTIDYRG